MTTAPRVVGQATLVTVRHILGVALVVLIDNERESMLNRKIGDCI